MYSANVPLIVEYLSPYDDTHDCKYSGKLELITSNKIGSTEVNITIKNETCEANLFNINAQNESEAFKIVKGMMHRELIALTFAIQFKNSNCHLDRIRINWKAGDIAINPKDNWPSDSIKIEKIKSIAQLDSQSIIEQIDKNPSFEFLLNSYYAALSPTDFRSKFYNAFTIIEYIEKNYSSHVKFTPIASKQNLNTLKKEVDKILKMSCFKEIRNKVRQTIGNLNQSTKEDRKEKLVQIIKKVFDVHQIAYATQILEVNEILIGKFIDIRNKLFHGNDLDSQENLEDNLKQIVYKLILLVESILLAISLNRTSNGSNLSK